MNKRLMMILMIILLLITAGCSAPDKPDDSVPVPDETEKSADEYGGGLFDDTKVHNIEITIAEKDWEDLLENAADKTKYHCDISIDGEEVKDVSCSAKGNSSLLMVNDLYDVKRYSLKIDFGRFVDDQKFHGLKKINLQNSFNDSTYLKDYLCYKMFNKAGVYGPLCSFSFVRVNDEDYGLFLAVEELDKNFLSRIGWKDAVLYKPDNDILEADNEDLHKIIVDGYQVIDYSEGAELSYRGEEIENYPDIFENNETKAEDEDKLRVIRALKALCDNRDLEEYLYTDELFRYFALQSFVLNYDSYMGPMLHNYYLCENKGKLAMFPWDYNTAFATSWARHNQKESEPIRMVNYGIDTPLFGTTSEQRPMWNWIVQNPGYLDSYHKAMDEFLETFFESGEFEKKMDEMIAMLKPYIEKDPTSFTGAERFSSSAEALKTFCLLRAQSMRKQLDNKLSTRTDEQIPEERIDASGITIDDLR